MRKSSCKPCEQSHSDKGFWGVRRLVAGALVAGGVLAAAPAQAVLLDPVKNVGAPIRAGQIGNALTPGLCMRSVVWNGSVAGSNGPRSSLEMKLTYNSGKSQEALRTVHKTFQDAFSESKLSVGTNYAANLNSNDPIQSIWRQPLDLFNGVTAVSIPNYGYGDFDSSAICGGQLGCHWFVGDDVKDSSPPPGAVAFATQLRGYLQVPTAWVNRPVNFGAFVDDAVSIALWDLRPDSTSSPYGSDINKYYQIPQRFILSRGQLAARPNGWIGNQVFFPQAGLYAIEIIYGQDFDAATLELSYKLGDPGYKNGAVNYEGYVFEPADRISLQELGFSLLTPEFFQQRLEGGDLGLPGGACFQCPREKANASGFGSSVGCPADPAVTGGKNLYCNEAALCAPCGLSDQHCGNSCTECPMGTTCKAQGNDYTCVDCKSLPGGCPMQQPCTSDDGCALDQCCATSPEGKGYCAPAGPDLTCRTVHGGALCCNAASPAARSEGGAKKVGGAGEAGWGVVFGGAGLAGILWMRRRRRAN